MRRALIAMLFAGLALPAQADTLSLALDEVQTVTFPRAVGTVNVGNPAIADITMIDARHAFVQGKGYGRTNLVALNQDGVQIFNTNITVTGANSGNTVVLNRGSQRITLNCAGQRCEPTPMPGDGKDAYDPANAVATAHQTNARTAASGAGGQ